MKPAIIIKRIIPVYFLFISVYLQAQPLQPIDLVDPWLGTAKSRWFFFGSACRPFGMVSLSPDTKNRGDWNSGYLYNEPHIRFFSHVHDWQLSGVAVMPTTGEFKGHLGNDAYKSTYSHHDEIVKPGYHKIRLNNYHITAELTATARVGFHRYTFPKSEESYILFDLGAHLGPGPKAYAEAWKVNDQAIAGFEIMDRTARRPKNTPIYFYVEFSKPFNDILVWRGQKIYMKDAFPNEKYRVSGGPDSVGMAVKYHTRDGEQLLMKVALSYVSVEKAKKNLDMELPHWDFERVKQESFDQWNNMLGRIKVEGGTPSQQVKFYTNLFHSLLGRKITSDADGQYIDMTGDYPKVRQTSKDRNGNYFPHYNFDALWGAQWSLNILWGLAYPDIYDGFCNTLTDMYKDGGLIPRGPSGGNYTFVMIGDPAAWFIGSAYQKGISTYDIELAYEGLRKNAFPGGIRDRCGYEFSSHPVGGGMEYYIKIGYVPCDKPKALMGNHGHASSAMTLEYAYSDWCLAQLAKSLGKTDDYELFMKRSRNYKNVWNPASGFMEGRQMNGMFQPGFDPGALSAFCESNSYIYSYFVPHDMSGLARLMGSEKAAAKRLNEQFIKGEAKEFQRGYVDYFNQPGTALGHVFNHLNHPWLSQYWIHKVLASPRIDNISINGYTNDEDQGLMGSLQVCMAIGLFELTGGADDNPFYEITTPVFDQVTICLDNNYYPGKSFTIKTINNSSSNIYIKSAKLNGKPLNSCWFYHSDLIQGGELELELDKKPNKKWGLGGVPVGN
ncbi:MAG: GH92 family glycosyl hydrolase [Mangrovibacterium sp.]